MALKYKIKAGVTFRPYGEKSLLTNENLTDAMAEMFIKKNPNLLGKIFENKMAETEPAPAPMPKKRGRKKKVVI